MSTQYAAHNDTLVAIFYDEDMYDERIDAVLRVFRSFADKTIVALEISNARAIFSDPEIRECASLWSDDATILAIPIEIARRHAGSSVEEYAPVIDALGSKLFRWPDELR